MAVIKTYNAGKNNPALERIGNFLESKFDYGFADEKDGSNTLCFFDKKEIFALIYESGKIEFSPSINFSIASRIEKELNYGINLN